MGLYIRWCCRCCLLLLSLCFCFFLLPLKLESHFHFIQNCNNDNNISWTKENQSSEYSRISYIQLEKFEQLRANAYNYTHVLNSHQHSVKMYYTTNVKQSCFLLFYPCNFNLHILQQFRMHRKSQNKWLRCHFDAKIHLTWTNSWKSIPNDIPPVCYLECSDIQILGTENKLNNFWWCKNLKVVCFFSMH